MKNGLLIGLVVLAIGVLVLGFFLFTTASAKKQKIAELASTNAVYAALVEGQAKAIADVKGTLAVRDGDLKKARTEIQKLKDEAESNIADATKKLTETVAANDAALEKSKKDIVAAQELLAQEQVAHKATKDTVAEREATIKAKESEISTLNATVKDWQTKEKAAVVVAERYKGMLLANKNSVEPEKKFHGNVLVVNREQEFLILDLGADDSVPVGTKLEVIRDNHLVGKVTVQKLVPDNNQLSIATVDSLVTPADTVREGDAVKN